MDSQAIAIEELKLVQAIISNQENTRLKIMGWGVAAVVAISVSYLAERVNMPPSSYLGPSVIIIGLFLWLDVIHRVSVDRAIERSATIEQYLRDGDDYDGPKIGLSMSVSNGLSYQLNAVKNIRVYAPYLALTGAVLVVYLFH